MKLQRSVLLVFVLCGIHGVWSMYPLCTPRDDSWEHVAQFDQDGAVSSCRNTCRTSRSVTFSGIRRNGRSAAKAECYCIVTPPATSVGRCYYKCGGQQCGGDNTEHSVYPVCTEGRYGASCGSNCPGACADGVCDVFTGYCPAGCADGRHGAACDQPCGQCANRVCDQLDAVCEGGCLDGWFTPTCTSECPEKCQSAACNIHNAACSHGCEDGYYNANCTNKCSDNCANMQCERDNGYCVEGCEDGWYRANCTQQCSDACSGATLVCDQLDGRCPEGCIDGWYEPHCTERCSPYCNATTCGLQDGHCLYGCTAGYHGPTCENACPAQCSNSDCERYSGNCYSCQPGYHGSVCDQKCSVNCAEVECTMMTGTCTQGCQCGWYGVHCDQARTGCDSPSWVWPVYVISVLVAFILGGISSFLYITKRAQSAKEAAHEISRNTDVAEYENCDSVFANRTDEYRGDNEALPSNVSHAEMIEPSYIHLEDHIVVKPRTYDTLNI